MMRAMMGRGGLEGKGDKRGLGMILAGLAAVLLLGAMLLALLVALQKNAARQATRGSAPARRAWASRARSDRATPGEAPPQETETVPSYHPAPAVHTLGFGTGPGEQMAGRAP